MRLREVPNGTGAFTFHTDGDPEFEPLPVNGRWFHRGLDEAIINASRIGLIVHTNGEVVTDTQHHQRHRRRATTVGADGINRCQVHGDRWYNLTGRTALDVALGGDGS